MLDELDTKTLGKRISEELQKHSGLTQEDLAGELCAATSTIGRWIRGDTVPNLHNFYRLARILGVSMDELVSGGASGRTKPASINYQGKPVITLMREPRKDERKGIRIAQLMFQGRTRRETMERLDIPEEEAFWQHLRHIVYNEMLFVETSYVPLNEALEKELKETFDLKTCVVADLGKVSNLLKTVVVGALGAKEIIKLFEKFRIRLKIGFVGGFSCGRVIISLIQTRQLSELELDVMPIAVQPVEQVVDQDANTLVGMLGFFTKGTKVRVYGVPYVSNAILQQEPPSENPVTREMLEKATQVDVAFLGLGGDLNYIFHQKAIRPEHDTFGGKTIFELKQMGCIGDILYTLVTEEGPMPAFRAYCDQIVCSIGLERLQRLSAGHSHVIAVVAGQNKSSVARLALEKRYINGLVTESELARAVLEGG